ncbi:hypothetical protein A2U01_0007992 [Trifolium medium]|uniref:Uncharacterized protein n=1 Tax=Trifolium medium TaxID=97028 RepID=A0A392MI09_9FABA|nr:hypothetical protein [Trifolium medium]
MSIITPIVPRHVSTVVPGKQCANAFLRGRPESGLHCAGCLVVLSGTAVLVVADAMWFSVRAGLRY